MKARYIISSPATGFENMAVDEAIFQNTNENNPLTLRFYEWNPVCITLGYSQCFSEIPDLSEKTDITRRITGGCAILHQKELTISIAAYANQYFPRDIVKSYELMKDILKRGFAEFDIGLYGIDENIISENKDYFCFNVDAVSDLFFDDTKVIGMAQKRAGKKWMLHCSIQKESNTTFNNNLPEAYLKVFEKGNSRITDSIINKFDDEFNISAEKSDLTIKEKALVPELILKYKSNSWIKKK